MPTQRRDFGNVRRLPSGRWQATYQAPDGRRVSAPSTFVSKREATDWLAGQRSTIVRGAWVDPGAGRERFDEYAGRWLASRPLAEGTRVNYEQVLRDHILPDFGPYPLHGISVAMVREWFGAMEAAGTPGPPTRARAYRLLRSILTTAVDDEALGRNPARLRDAGREPASAERPTVTVDQVRALAERVDDRYRAFLHLLTFGSLRWGEATGLRRRDVDLLHVRVTVRQSLKDVRGRISFGPPKTAGSYRTVVVGRAVAAILTDHLERFTAPDPNALVFTTPSGSPLRRPNFYNAQWNPARRALGLGHVHLHDLRGTGDTLAATVPGTTLRDLMDRLGHSTPRTALRYLHATDGQQDAIADALTAMIEAQPTPIDSARKRHQTPS